MKAVIMAGGLGTRLRPITEILPKPLLPLGDKSIIETLIGRLKKSGFTEIYLAVNYKSDLFESYLGDGSNYGVSIKYAKETKPLGTAGPLSNLKKELGNEPFLVVNGDILTTLDFRAVYQHHIDHQADLTLVTNSIKVPLNYGVVHARGHDITRIEEKPEMHYEINAGIYVLHPRVLDYLPENQSYLMTDLLQDLLRDGKKTIRYQLTDYWLDVGLLTDYEKARNDLQNGVLQL